MRLTFEALGHTLTIALDGHDDEGQPPPVDLDALVERVDPYPDDTHELDHRVHPVGFRRPQ